MFYRFNHTAIIQYDHRICPLCKLAVEREIHVMFHCQFYQNIRENVLPRACEMNTNFSNLSNEEKLVFMLSNENVMKISAKYCFMLLTLSLLAVNFEEH